MPYKPLFSEYDSYTAEGCELYDEVRSRIDAIVSKCIQKEYARADMFAIISDAVHMSITNATIMRGAQRKVDELKNK